MGCIMIDRRNVKYAVVQEPFWGLPAREPLLSDGIYARRKERVLQRMRKDQYDFLLFYADREHYNTFDYMVGFGPRFEEGILVLSQQGEATLLLGNECFGMYRTSRIPANGVLFQTLSLPSQTIDQYAELADILSGIGIKQSHRVGIVGWKLMYPCYGTRSMFDVPCFIIDSVRAFVSPSRISNVTDWFIHPGYGLRTINGAEEIASYEFGASYASDSVQNMLLHLRTGMTEVEISQYLTCGALPTACFPKVLAGDRLDLGMVSPTTNTVKLGDRFQVSMGLRGGLTNRRGFVAYSEEDLAENARDYMDKFAKPYFAAAASWYEQIGLDVDGGAVYDTVQRLLPQEEYGWVLNPGHLISTEEWLSSPIFPKSDIPFRSGMCVQMDIIPATERRYASPNCEDGVAIADEALRNEIAERFPDVYARMQHRRAFMEDAIHIRLKPEVLPLSNLTGLYRPFMLNRDRALVIER